METNHIWRNFIRTNFHYSFTADYISQKRDILIRRTMSKAQFSTNRWRLLSVSSEFLFEGEKGKTQGWKK